jgi:hypothetical protein
MTLSIATLSITKLSTMTLTLMDLIVTLSTGINIECHYAECLDTECRFFICCYAECRYAECFYAECRYAECCYAECHGALVSSQICSSFLCLNVWRYEPTYFSCKTDGLSMLLMLVEDWF